MTIFIHAFGSQRLKEEIEGMSAEDFTILHNFVIAESVKRKMNDSMKGRIKMSMLEWRQLFVFLFTIITFFCVLYTIHRILL